MFLGLSLEAPPGIEPGIRVLQTRALPLGHGAVPCMKKRRFAALFCGAGNGARTRHLSLGKAALYQMSYSRRMVPQSGLEPPTQGFSVPCSTN